MIEAFTAAFVIGLISEIADKTQLVILGLALKFKSPIRVFLGALLAHALMDGIAIILGSFFGFSLSSNLIKILIGILFIVVGVWIFIKIFLKKAKKEKSKEKKLAKYKTPLAISFLTVLLSEFGDKTQIASGLLAAKYLVPVAVFVGIILALTIAIGLNVFVGTKIAEKLPRKAIKVITAVLFVLFGIFTLIF